MLAALILQVTDKSESEALKLMIYLIEGVLPDSYFADSLRGLSVDMAVFRELLRSKLPKLSKHLDILQNAAKDGLRSYEPPLTNVFTMQWFLTLFCNCLPQPSVLRVWDLIFLEGNEILLRTALAIWKVLAPRILAVRTADEFYCIMGVLTRELLEFDLIDANSLIKSIVSIGSLNELKSLRYHYLHNISSWDSTIPRSENKQNNLHSKNSVPLDISALKKQYVRLKQRQRQAHVIFSAAISRQPTQASHVAVNHLNLGKHFLDPSKRLSPLKGSTSPAIQKPSNTLQWKDTEKLSSSSSSSDTELCDDNDVHSFSEDEGVITKSQFKNNLKSIDSNRMENDNIYDDKNINISTENTINLNEPTDIQATSSLRAPRLNLEITSDSEDKNSDFELFLADRVKCLREKKLFKQSYEGSDKLTRRNSERALQIIQENSLILHRIVQCQARLSPSPSLIFNDTCDKINAHLNIANDPAHYVASLLNDNIKSKHESSTKLTTQHVYSFINTHDIIEGQTNNDVLETQDIVVEPSSEYNSRYHSILEKSKSLDERFNNFIMSHNDAMTSKPFGLHESKSETNFSPKLGLVDSMTKLTTPNFLEYTFYDVCLPSAIIYETDGASSIDQKYTKSKRLIQENLDLLKTFSSSRSKLIKEKPDFSQKLMWENDRLLEHISSEREASVSLTDNSNNPNNSITVSDKYLSTSYLDNNTDNCDIANVKEFSSDNCTDLFSIKRDTCDSLFTKIEYDLSVATEIDYVSKQLEQKTCFPSIMVNTCSDATTLTMKEKDLTINFIDYQENEQNDFLIRLNDNDDSTLESHKQSSTDNNVKRCYSLSPTDLRSKDDNCDNKIGMAEANISPTSNESSSSENGQHISSGSKLEAKQIGTFQTRYLKEID